ncbi:MAG: cardiolipin synthase [Thermodesulfobacteriota bacterium]
MPTLDILNWMIVILILTLDFLAAGHALLYKRDPRAAWAWIIICIMLPTIGPFLYFLLGINRVRTKAKKLKWYWPPLDTELADQKLRSRRSEKTVYDFEISPDFHQLAHLSEALSNRMLLAQNNVETLYNGEQAYPDMLQAIRRAQKSVLLASYIFDSDHTGRSFVQALAEAQARGLDVRVMVDGIGEFYSRPRIGHLLKKEGIPFTRFLPLKFYPPSPFINLRNHRKLLILDGETGFTGGMNIGDSHLVQLSQNPKRKQDIHFKFQGPIVAQMEEVFLEDWSFCTGDYSRPERSWSEPGRQDSAICRTITVGPNQDLDKLRMLLTGVVSQAKSKISIMTPYFLPSRELTGALQTAALKGVDVDIVLPQVNNLPYVHWATQNMLWELLQWGVKVFYQPAPFNHSKLFLADDSYALVGSANLDPRSLRLNFELVVEVYSQELVRSLEQHVQDKISVSHEVTLQEVDSRTFPVRCRDSLCWLFSPYL